GDLGDKVEGRQRVVVLAARLCRGRHTIHQARTVGTLLGLNVTHAKVARQWNGTEFGGELAHQPDAAILLLDATRVVQTRRYGKHAVVAVDIEKTGDRIEIRHHPVRRIAVETLQ